MALAALLCSLGTLILSLVWGARCVLRCSTLASLATRREKAPEKWQSRLAELESEVLSLSSTFEKTARLTTRLNSRAGMRELRAEPETLKDGLPPPSAGKQALRAALGVGGISGRAMQEKMQLVSSQTTKE